MLAFFRCFDQYPKEGGDDIDGAVKGVPQDGTYLVVVFPEDLCFMVLDVFCSRAFVPWWCFLLLLCCLCGW
jgi:hypothetical protein